MPLTAESKQQAHDGVLAVLGAVYQNSHHTTYACRYGLQNPDQIQNFQKEFRKWVEVIEKGYDQFCGSAESSELMKLLRRGCIVAGIDPANPVESAYRELLPFLTATQRPVLYDRLKAEHDNFYDLRALIALFDYMGFPFEPLNMMPAPTMDELLAHRRVVGCSTAMVTYSRWLTEVDIMLGLTDVHKAMSAAHALNSPWQLSQPDPNKLELETTNLLWECLVKMKAFDRAAAKALFDQSKVKQIEVLDRIEELVKDPEVQIKSTYSDGGDNHGENVFLEYGQQMVRLSNYVNRLFEEGDKWGHWFYGKDYPGKLWTLIDKSNWDTIMGRTTTLAASRGVQLD